MTIKDKHNREHHNVELRSNLSKENNMSAQSSWNMKKTMTVVLATAPLLLAGCGGGGGGGGGSTASPSPSSPSSPATPATPSPSPVASAAAVPTYTMSDLVVPDGFDYSSIEQFDIDIDISSISIDRSFVTVYSRFSARDDSTLKPDYSSKVIAGSLNNGVFASNFTSPVSHDSLLVEIWFYDGQPPLQKVVSSSNSQIVW